MSKGKHPKLSEAEAERARCATIIRHGIETGTVREAASYAFESSMTAEAAIATLDGTAAEATGAVGAHAVTEMCLAAARKAHGEPV